MFPGMNPRKMQTMMRKMGVAQEEIDAKEVIIKCPDKDIVITEPTVAKIKMMGQEQFTISGNVNERKKTAEMDISEEDIATVLKQVKVDRETAKEALEKAKGDIAQAIINLQNHKNR